MSPTNNLSELPEDSQALQAVVRSLLGERGSLLLERDADKRRVIEQTKRADDLHIENLRLQLELDRYT